MGARPGSKTWVRFWCTLVCIQLLFLVGPTLAGRDLKQQQQHGSKQIRLQAHTDANCTKPRHAPPVQSFLVSDGSWVDCVPIQGQIAAHHPSLKDHVIQMAPPRPASTKRHPQLFAQEHGGCQDGYIPVLRDDPNRRFMDKAGPPRVRREHADDVSTESTDPATTTQPHEYAITEIPMKPNTYSGTHSVFSVNAPVLGSQDEMSLSQFWIVDGTYDDNSLSTIEVGWQTQPNLHPTNDPNDPHLFIFWTNSAYTNTDVGTCYDLKCPGFVQQSSTWVMGGVLRPFTTLAENAQTEYEVEIEVQYQASDGNWWLYLNTEAVGYWPSSIYGSAYMQGTANQVQWGGEVAIIRETGVSTHSTCAMGSGAFPSDGYPVSAYQRNLTYSDASGSVVVPDPSDLQTGRVFDNPLCYNIEVQQGSFTNWGSYFFFGGSGGNNPGCQYS